MLNFSKALKGNKFEDADIKAKTTACLDSDIKALANEKDAESQRYLGKLQAEREKRNSVTKEHSLDGDAMTELQFEGTPINPVSYTSILKGTTGHHWKWHQHAGSQVANSHGEKSGFKSSHSETTSHFNKRFKDSDQVVDSAEALHNHLTNGGFKYDGMTDERLPNRYATRSTYSHPDGTKVISITNTPYDNMTEHAHDFAVFHSDKDPQTAPTEAQGLNHPVDHMAAANTMIQQYGGNKFRAMTGAKNFLAGKEADGSPSMTFKIPQASGASKGVTHVKTILRPDDTYEVHMIGVRKKNGIPTATTKHVAKGLYADQLQSHFTHHTGLYTHL